MQTGSHVEVVGDRYGHNSANDVPENLGKRGILGEQHTVGFWWVKLPSGDNILAYETELKEVQ
jgi:hypothetical protein